MPPWCYWQVYCGNFRPTITNKRQLCGLWEIDHRNHSTRARVSVCNSTYEYYEDCGSTIRLAPTKLTPHSLRWWLSNISGTSSTGGRNATRSFSLTAANDDLWSSRRFRPKWESEALIHQPPFELSPRVLWVVSYVFAATTCLCGIHLAASVRPHGVRSNTFQHEARNRNCR